MTIAIKDGVGIINGEFATDDVTANDLVGKGFDHRTRQMRIDCGNGYKLSVVFGSCTYSDNHDHGLASREWFEEVERAEIGVLGPHGLVGVFDDEWGDTVKGYCDIAEVMHWLERTRRHGADTAGAKP